MTRPDYWGVFLVNTVFWIGISHAGTFISAILRVMKIEGRRPFTRAAELMTTFGLVQAGASIFMHLGRVWLGAWLFPFPNERQLWPDFHSPLMWDFLAINTYLLCSTMYLFLPLIPDIAMVRDRTKGWLKIPYRILSLGFRGTEGEWKNLTTAMNIFAFAVIPVMFSVHTIVSWDFAMALQRSAQIPHAMRLFRFSILYLFLLFAVLLIERGWGGLLARLAAAGQVYFEISMLDSLGTLDQLAEDVSIERVLFGSNYPLFYFESAVLKVREASLAEPQRQAIFEGNARRLSKGTNR